MDTEIYSLQGNTYQPESLEAYEDTNTTILKETLDSTKRESSFSSDSNPSLINLKFTGSQENKLNKFNEEPKPSPHLLPAGLPLINQRYSMKADMLFGWQPKYTPTLPVPLKFKSKMVDQIVQTLYEGRKKYTNLYDKYNSEKEKENEEYPEVIYQGFRPNNTFEVHEKYQHILGYNIIYDPTLFERYRAAALEKKEPPVNPDRPFNGMKPGIKEDCIVFDSQFEGGNLDTAIRVGKDEYHLYIRVDSNTKGHTHW